MEYLKRLSWKIWNLLIFKKIQIWTWIILCPLMNNIVWNCWLNGSIHSQKKKSINKYICKIVASEYLECVIRYEFDEYLKWNKLAESSDVFNLRILQSIQIVCTTHFKTKGKTIDLIQSEKQWKPFSMFTFNEFVWW